MSTRRNHFAALAFLVLLGALAVTSESGQVAKAGPDTSITLFRARVDAYTRLRRQIVSDLLENGIDPSLDGGRRFRQRLGAALRTARSHSQPGDVFCPELAGHMRAVVWSGLAGESDLLSEVPEVAHLRVNDEYPAGEPIGTVPPSLLRQFEPLPPELQYRFLSNALILLDIDAALIVDFVPNAFERAS
jgi:hypothetical protein